MKAELQERVYSLIRKADQTDYPVEAAHFAHAAKEVAEALQIVQGLTGTNRGLVNDDNS